ncbi:hypothetical protein KC19_2G061600 [Ceratodon purpureus]|uniref:Zinc finger PHD-type domain-containing protein n=1 Tax=Ceratodon purpureus TaxID=3225 RepID=A0A8T0ISD2_CERPU|nr:hypothetical protein KC19_2G061600 [Ceratodon purpureus]
MARIAGSFVMTGSKHGEYYMRVEFLDDAGRAPIQLRERGYYLGKKTHTEMVEEIFKASGLQSTVVSVGEEKSTVVSVGEEKPDGTSVGNKATASVDELRNVESQTSNGNSSRTAMDFVEEAPGRSQLVAGLPLQVVPEEPVGSVEHAVDFRRRDFSSEQGDEAEITDVDEYTIFNGDESNPVSLCVLPLEFEDRELIAEGVSVSTSEVSLCGKSGGLDVKCAITAWKLTFSKHEPFRILVKVMPMSGVKRWVKLEEPRSSYKESAEEVLCVARFLDILKKEPHASEEIVRNRLLEGGVLSMTFCDRLRKQRLLIEQYIDLDLALKEADARKTLLSLTREKATGKRVLLLNDGSSDEDDYPPVKKPKMDHTRPEDVSMREYESEEEFYSDEDVESEDELGDSLCIFCDDGGYLLCCDGPCMRSFHPRRIDGTNSQCATLGFPDKADMENVRRGWFCTNCKTKKHQCYVCEGLGNSDAALGRKREVFVCDVASCGKFYHPRCIASKLKPGSDEREAREALAKGIRAGESFTCPLHRCKKCGKGEEKKERDLNLATCRRCPAAWHVKCLPRTLSFDGDEESHFEVRAWLLDKLFIVYCTDHKLLPDLGTPARNHIKFKENSSDSTTTFKKPQKKVSTVGHERPDFRLKVSSSSVLQMPSKGTDTARPATQEPSGEAYKRLVRDIVGKSHRAITEESVKAKLTLPTIYSRREFNWMPQGRFDSILNGARAAMEWLKQGVNWEDAKLKCARDQVVAIHAEESHLRTFLAPTLHGKRYTSYGRHFTKVEKLKKVVEVLEPHIRDGDTIVDFSCGDNTFARLLLDALSNSEKSKCQFKNFDIFTPKDTFGFERRDWLSVGVNECGPGDNLVIGLNPPFMYTDVFISHALSMNPRVLVFIIPPLKKPLPHYGFECVLDDPTTMAEKSFYLPGSVHGLNDDHMEQGNHVAPHLYIFVRPATSGGSIVSPPLTVNSSLSTIPNQQLHKSEKRVNPETPTPESDPTANLFIRGKRSRDPRRPQHMVPKIMSGAPGFGSHSEEAGILPPPPPVTPYVPPPPPPPPFRSLQVHDSPRDHLPPRFHPQHYPEVRPPHPLDEPYSPFEPGLFPSGAHYNNPREFSHALRGSRPPVFRGMPSESRDLRSPWYGHLRPTDYRGMAPPEFRNFPPRGFGHSHPPEFRDFRPPGFGDQPPPGYEDFPPASGGWLPAE